jgi:DNA-binding CsgD family transcriptional regulator/tetratricopeptide (TPR) repeat protein
MAHADAASVGAGLLERTEQLDLLQVCWTRATQTGQGGTILVAGEAGIGKTTLLRYFAAEVPAGTRILRTSCDPLFTPRLFGPLVELAAGVSSGLAAEIADSSGPFDAAIALSREIRQMAPAVLVIEDVHWADEATLDVVRVLARRLDSMPVLLILSYRDEEFDRAHPLRVVLGDLASPGRVLARVTLPGLSESAIGALANGEDIDARELHTRTNGNPFFVTEVLAAGTHQVPRSVHDAVLARAARLSGPARDLLDAAAVVPGHVNGQLLAGLDPAAAGHLDECLGTGMLTAAGGQVAFRHEIARVVIEESLPAGRRAALHRKALSLLEGNVRSASDPARMVHHADAAGDSASVLRYAPAAGDLAAAAGAHREAAKLYQRALEVAVDIPPDERASLLERFAAEGYLATLGNKPLAALTEALEIYRSRHDVLGQGRVQRQLARHYGRQGSLAEMLASIQESIALLERLPPTSELALAFVNLAATYGVLRRPDAVTFGQKGLALGEELDCAEAIYQALDIIGAIELVHGDIAAGIAKLDRSRALAEEARDSSSVALGFVHLIWMLAMRREWLVAEPYFQPAIGYCRDHGFELFRARLVSLQMEAQFARGRWDEAADTANAILADSGQLAAPERCAALRVLGSIRARRGDPGYWPLFDEARELTKLGAAAVLLAPIATARAEAAWLEGRAADVLSEVAFAAGTPDRDPFATLDLQCWAFRAGGDTSNPAALPEPYRAFLSGDRHAAARWWEERDCPYDAALALIGSGDIEALRAAAVVLRDLGARPALAIAARELRALGATRVPRVPERARPSRTAGLTDREVEVLRLLAAGWRNADIAAHLVVSPRTVDHHVSAILKKLSVRSRSEAVTAALRLGLVQAPPPSPLLSTRSPEGRHGVALLPVHHDNRPRGPEWVPDREADHCRRRRYCCTTACAIPTSPSDPFELQEPQLNPPLVPFPPAPPLPTVIAAKVV